MKHWNHLVPFVAAARESSFRKAAAQLGVTPGAVSQNIAQFEKRLGVALFYRTTREVRLTEEGARLFEMLHKQVQELDHTLSLAGELQREPSGTIKIGTFPFFGRRWLIPLFSDFRRLYPKINLDILFSYNLSENDQLDIVVRNGLPASSNLKYYEVMEMKSVLVASPRYLDYRGTPQNVEDLAFHTQILLDGGSLRWYYRDRSITKPTTSGYSQGYTLAPTSSDQIVLRGQADALYDMVRSGAGVAMFHDEFVREDLETGELVRILEDEEFCQREPSVHKIYVGNRGDGKMTTRESLLFKHIMDGLSGSIGA